MPHQAGLTEDSVYRGHAAPLGRKRVNAMDESVQGIDSVYCAVYYPHRTYHQSARRSTTPARAFPAHPHAHFRPIARGDPMTWVKPKFEVVSLCMEITTYAHSR